MPTSIASRRLLIYVMIMLLSAAVAFWLCFNPYIFEIDSCLDDSGGWHDANNGCEFASQKTCSADP